MSCSQIMVGLQWTRAEGKVNFWTISRITNVYLYYIFKGEILGFIHWLKVILSEWFNFMWVHIHTSTNTHSWFKAYYNRLMFVERNDAKNQWKKIMFAY